MKAFGGEAGLGKEVGRLAYGTGGDEKELAKELEAAYIEALAHQDLKEKAEEGAGFGKIANITQEIVINSLGGDNSEIVRGLQELMNQLARNRS